MAPTKTPPKLVQANETFSGSFSEKSTDEDGNEVDVDVPYVVRRGETYAADHAIVRKHGQFFGPVQADSERHGPMNPDEVVY